MGKIKIEGYICERCKHQWVARGIEEPRVCPRCKSPYWDRPRRIKKKLKGIKKSKTKRRKRGKK
jgi:uncharacterized CHY-type Zn-finger protein